MSALVSFSASNGSFAGSTLMLHVVEWSEWVRLGTVPCNRDLTAVMRSARDASAYAVHNRSMGAAGIQQGSQNSRIVAGDVTDSFAIDRHGNRICVVGILRFADQHGQIAGLNVAQNVLPLAPVGIGRCLPDNIEDFSLR
jgi:hypothetical protein